MPLDLQGYTVKITTLRATRRGVYWCGVIKHQDAVIGECCNQGNGGQTVVTIHQPHHTAYHDAAVAACPKSYEPESRFAERLADYADGFDTDQ